jgi:hypothetical protein
MTWILVCATLEADWKDREERDVTHGVNLAGIKYESSVKGRYWAPFTILKKDSFPR